MRSSREGGRCEIVGVDPDDPDAALVRRIAGLLREGGVAAFPTDTIYGLGCSSKSVPGLERLRGLKGIGRTTPFILLVGDKSWVRRMAQPVTPLAERLINEFWPGPLTVVLDAAPGLSGVSVSEAGTVALRLPRSGLCVSMCLALDAPIASTSANRVGCPPATEAIEAAREFGGQIDVVLDGGPPRRDLPSTIVDARGERPVVLRPGSCDLRTSG